jgi:hypothetical protein
MVTIAKPFYERHDRKDHVILWKFPIETKTTNGVKIAEAIRAQPEFQKLRDLLTQAGNGMVPRADWYSEGEAGEKKTGTVLIGTATRADFPVAVAFLRSVFSTVGTTPFGARIDKILGEAEARKTACDRASAIVNNARKAHDVVVTKAREHAEAAHAAEIEAFRNVAEVLHLKMQESANQFARDAVKSSENLPDDWADREHVAALLQGVIVDHDVAVPMFRLGYRGLLGVSERRVFDNDVGFVAATLWEHDDKETK